MSTPLGIVLVLADHHRWDHLAGAGMSCLHTPNLDALAARGTSVTGMYSTAPLCVPQRIALTAGRYCMNTGCFSNRHPMNPDIPTFIRCLRESGVQTALIGKFHHHVHAWDADFIGHDMEIRRLGFDFVHEVSGKMAAGSIGCECEYVRFLRSRGILEEYRAWCGRWGKKNATRQSNEPWRWDENTTQDAYIATKACEHIAQMPTDRRFYLQVGFVGPHPPFDAPAEYHELYREVEPPPRADGKPRDPTGWRAYAACISEVDAMVGRVVEALRQKNILDQTIILYSSDHGDCAGDNGRWGKINFYEGSVHVPMIAAGPGIPAGRSVNTLAEMIDLGRTICDFVNVSSHHFDQGLSFTPLLTGQADTHRSDVFAEMGSDKMLFDGRYKLMYGDVTRDTRKEYAGPPYNGPAFGRPVNLPPDKLSLYDLQTDPHELKSLADDPTHAELLARMKEKLLQRIIANMQARPEGEGSVL